MPQPPGSQPTQFYTPNASKFRLPKRADDKSATPLAASGAGLPSAGLPSAVRPAPRFTPSWRRHSFLPPSQAQAQAQVPSASGIYTPRPISRHARQFSSVGRPRNHTLKGAPALCTEDSIEDGSSPPRAEDESAESAPEPIDTEETQVGHESENQIEIESTEESLAARDSPTIVRALTEHPRHVEHLHRRRQDPQEGIEDSGETAVPDSLTFDTNTGLAATTPGLPRDDTEQPKSVLPQQRSVTRLLSSVQPFKRRRLFVPPGMITSSPSQDDESGDVGYDVESKRPQRRPWETDIDDDDDEGDTEGVRNDYEYEEIRDIVKYGELLEYGDSDDERNDDHDRNRDKDGDAEQHENEEGDNDDDYSIFDRTPTRVRRARQEELEKAQSISNSRPAQPVFQRARLFMSARRMAEVSGVEGVNHDNDDNDDLLQVDTTSAHNNSSHKTTRPVDYVLPAPDFFSPQKKKRRNAKNKSKRQSVNEEGIDGAAAAPIQSTAATAEQYVPGGLAAELRDWLVQIKNGSGMAATMAKPRTRTKSKPPRNILGVYQVGTLPESSLGMRLVVARQTPATPTSASTSMSTRLLLAGEDKSAGARRAGTRQAEPLASSRSTVSVAAPAWEVVLDGQSWVVASNWSGGRPG